MNKIFIAIILSAVIVGGFIVLPKIANAATVNSISPTDIIPGTTALTIQGNGFGTIGHVCFDVLISNTIYSDWSCVYSSDTETIWKDTAIRLMVPTNAASGSVTIHYYNPYLVTLSAGIIFVKPSITSFITNTQAPTLATPTAPGYPLGIIGTNFGSVAGRVFIDSQLATSYVWNPVGIAAIVPALTFDTYVGSRSVSVQVQIFNTITGQFSLISDPINVIVSPAVTNDTFSYRQYYLSLLGLPVAWNVPLKKQPIVAVIDSGVYLNHPDLADHIWQNNKEKIGNGKDDDKDGYIDDVFGWNFIDNNNDMTPKNGHGTMVAGIIAASQNNKVGIAGINPNAKIMPLIACDSSGCDFSTIEKAMRFAVDHGADVINVSISTHNSNGYTTEFNDAVQYANTHGVVIVSSAGNGDVEGGQGIDLARMPQSPACNDLGSKNAIIGVAASTEDGKYRTTWTNYASQGTCVDVFTPGVDIVSTSVPAFTSSDGFTVVDKDGFYSSANGTSFSAPIISGVVSLLKQEYPTMSPAEVMKRIYKYSVSGSLDAIGLLTEIYTAPIFHPSIQSLKLTKGVYSYKLNGKTTTIHPFGNDYKGTVWAKSVDFGTNGKIYIFMNSNKYKKGQIKVFKADGKLLKAYNPYSGFAINGLNATAVVQTNNSIYLTVASTKGESTVKNYQVTAKGLKVLPRIIAISKSGNLLVSFQKLYSDQYGLVTMKQNDRKTLRVWKFNSSTNKYVEDKKINKSKIKI